uniref:NADH dehydrogenase (Ubiquinone) 1 alpha subcomplex subunit 8-like n=1 Tax=Hirondellea gigas TaxID=1518452 RepID=A0A2P2HY34_9CRUS
MLIKAFELPTEEELVVEEINLSTPSLRAGAFHLGKYCEIPSKEYMLCKSEEKDMRKCVEEGRILTACGLEFFRTVKKTCKDEFIQFANCIDRSSTDYKLAPCRNTQGVFDSCMLDKLDMVKPSYGYYCRAKIHQTIRSKPPGYLSHDYPDAAKPIVIPPASELPDAKHGSRVHWYP